MLPLRVKSGASWNGSGKDRQGLGCGFGARRDGSRGEIEMTMVNLDSRKKCSGSSDDVLSGQMCGRDGAGVLRATYR